MYSIPTLKVLNEKREKFLTADLKKKLKERLEARGLSVVETEDVLLVKEER